MADIRINALTTTATSSASDDYIAIDGTANGTRKLSVYSPTFGGNLTVSGTGTNSFSGPISQSSSDNTKILLSNGNPSIWFSPTAGAVSSLVFNSASASFRIATASDSAQTGYSALMTVTSGGNLLLGTTTDNGSKLQIAGESTFASSTGNIAQFYRTNTTPSNAGLQIAADNSGAYLSTLQIQSFRIFTNGVTALTIDSSQNATFAGRIGLTASGTSTIYSNFIPADSGTFAGNITMQAGGGSGAFGGGLSLYGPSHATKPGWVSIGMSATTGAKFAVNDSGLSAGTDLFTIDRNANQFIKNSTVVPAANPTGGGYLYVDSGALKYRGSSGTVTTIAIA